jgi:nucleoside-diphosphate-sugar epimerase
MKGCDNDVPLIYFEVLTWKVLSLLQVRDYIHVVDLADGHIAALRKLDDPKTGTITKFIIFF